METWADTASNLPGLGEPMHLWRHSGISVAGTRRISRLQRHEYRVYLVGKSAQSFYLQLMVKIIRQPHATQWIHLEYATCIKTPLKQSD